LIHAIDLAKETDRNELKKWLDTTGDDLANEKIKSVTTLFNKLGVKTICEDKMQFFYSKAIANLEKVTVL